MERVGARVFGPTLLGKLVTDTFPVLIYRSAMKLNGYWAVPVWLLLCKSRKMARVKADRLKLMKSSIFKNFNIEKNIKEF